MDDVWMRAWRGEVSFAAFARETMRTWQRLAKHVAKRWRQPPWVTLDDLVQDLLMGAWTGLQRFDPTRGVAVSRYVVYSAMDRCKKAAHKHRGAPLHRRSDHAPSQFDRAFSSFGALPDHVEDRNEERILGRVAVQPNQDEATTRCEAKARAVAACPDPRERALVRALVTEEDVDLAARAVYGDIDLRLALRLGSERDARRVVHRAARAAAERAEAAA